MLKILKDSKWIWVYSNIVGIITDRGSNLVKLFPAETNVADDSDDTDEDETDSEYDSDDGSGDENDDDFINNSNNDQRNK